MENWNTRESLLIRAANPDDHEAFEEFAYYYKNFFKMVFSKLGVSPDQAGDLEQELLIKLWKDIGKFDMNREDSNFRGWLSVVIRHEVYRFFRKNKKEVELKDSLLADDANESEIDRLIEEEWKAYIITLAIEKMKSHFDGKAMELFQLTLDGKGTSEIAETLNIAENSVYVLRSRVKSRFQNEIRNIRSFLEIES